MDGARHQLLARAALALDEHRGLGVADDREKIAQLLHGPRAADEIKGPGLPEPLAQGAVLLLERAFLQCAAHQRAPLLHVGGFGQEVIRPLPEGLHRRVDAPEGGEHDDRHLGARRPDRAEQGETIDVGEDEVENHEPEPRLGFRNRPGPLPGGRGEHRDPVLAQQGAVHLQGTLLVVDEEDLPRGARLKLCH